MSNWRLRVVAVLAVLIGIAAVAFALSGALRQVTGMAMPAEPGKGAIAVGTLRIVLMPLKKSDRAMRLTSASGLADIKCSPAAEKSACATTLAAMRDRWAGTKDGSNTSSMSWGVGGTDLSPSGAFVVRHASFGDADLVAVLERVTSGGSTNPTSAPSTTLAPSSTPTPSGSSLPSAADPPGWAAINVVHITINGHPSGEGLTGTTTCHPLATIETHDDLTQVPDTDHPTSAASRTAVFAANGVALTTQCLS